MFLTLLLYGPDESTCRAPMHKSEIYTADPCNNAKRVAPMLGGAFFWSCAQPETKIGNKHSVSMPLVTSTQANNVTKITRSLTAPLPALGITWIVQTWHVARHMFACMPRVLHACHPCCMHAMRVACMPCVLHATRFEPFRINSHACRLRNQHAQRVAR